MPTGASGASSRGEEPPDQRQTGVCSMQRPVILLSGLPPDLPDGFIRRAYRPSDRSSLPPTLPTGFVSQTFRPPDRQTYRTPDRTPARPPDRQTYRQVSFQRPDRPASPVARPAALPAASPVARPAASPASHTGHPHRQPHQPSSPAILTGHPHRPSTPAKVPPACLTGRLRSVGRRLRGWRSSRHG